ncbi:MAG: glucosamine-6-phosphate deaminase [Firmicutes bacterium]|jgi:glucosamine-6-phosphate deaminase|nr:glucosamine-6-phosphate deaminase [Bacillota bacterium]
MKVRVFESSEALGREAAKYCATILNKAILEHGNARLLMSTGASQFDTLKSLMETDVDWSKVAIFHLDEYVGLPESHPASFRKYLKDRFIDIVRPGEVHFVDGEGDIQKNIQNLTEEVRKRPIDLALVGIGENAHIAFNDPPADFHTEEAFIVVNLDEKCKRQQVREGWYETIDDVPKQAITMTVYQIMQSKVIVSCVPYKVKADAVKITLENEVTCEIPATMLKKHENVTLFLDEESASLVDKNILKSFL